jgi:multiple antibiotic resistance protein
MSIFSAAVVLFFVMDPLGNIPPFLSVLENVAPTRRRRVLARELLIALVILCVFLFLGQHLLDFMSLRQESISVAGGIVLFLIAVRMVFPPDRGMMGDEVDDEPLVVPLAVPLIAGPSTLATLLLFVRSEPARLLDWLAALGIAWVGTAVILFASPFFLRVLGKRGLKAVQRLMGMILVMLAVQMALEGVLRFLRT